MALGAYLGIDFVFIADSAIAAVNQGVRQAMPDPRILAIPLLLTFFLLTGLRFTFDMPAALEANWLFRTVPANGHEPGSVARKILLLATVPWQVVLLLPCMVSYFGWMVAMEHEICVLAFTVLLTNGLLLNFRKIPFTCSASSEIRRLIPSILGALISIAIVIPLLARMEVWMMKDATRVPAVLLIFAGTWYALRRSRDELRPENMTLTFDDRPAPALDLLKLARQE